MKQKKKDKMIKTKSNQKQQTNKMNEDYKES